jgi:hypothetical protein
MIAIQCQHAALDVLTTNGARALSLSELGSPPQLGGPESGANSTLTLQSVSRMFTQPLVLPHLVKP